MTVPNRHGVIKKKSDLKNETKGQIINLLAKYNIQICYLCCNNAGENDDFRKACNEEGMGMDFKYTHSDTPQQIG